MSGQSCQSRSIQKSIRDGNGAWPRRWMAWPGVAVRLFSYWKSLVSICADELAMLSAWTPNCCLTCNACSLLELSIHVGVNQRTDAAIDGISQALDEGLLHGDARLIGTKAGGRRGERGDAGIGTVDVAIEGGLIRGAVSQRRDIERPDGEGSRGYVDAPVCRPLCVDDAGVRVGRRRICVEECLPRRIDRDRLDGDGAR